MDDAALAHVSDPIHRDLSALAIVGNTLFASCDETASVERLIYDPEAERFASHLSFPLGDIFDLPGGRDGEMDIEGLEANEDWLWICGSHSLKRDDPESEGVAGLDDIDWDENRAFLGRVPLIDRGDGVFEPVGAFEPLDGAARLARALKMDKEGGALRRMLKDDPLLAPFLDIPCKENGLDIEGLAASGDTVWLGLRGPVIGAYAIVIEMTLKERASKPRRLKPKKIGKGPRYKLYAIDLHGQAIRDLLYVDGTMYFLTGATTDLEAMQAVYAAPDWPPREDVVRRGALSRIIDLPAVRGSDHAEGLALTGTGADRRFVIAFDSPYEERIDDRTQSIAVDLYDIPS